MKRTPLYTRHYEAGARMVEFAGFEMPVEYSGVIQEHIAVRRSAGIFDVSHMGVFWIKGKDALELLQYVTTNDVAALAKGQAQYTCLPNGTGGIVDDLIIYRYNQDEFILVVNASNIEKDWQWIATHNIYGAVLENASDRMSMIALQGPDSKDILQPLVGKDLLELHQFHFYTETIDSVGEITVSATGYTGAGGYELICYNDGAVKLWDALLESGKNFGLVPVGLAARDTLRLEMGYCLYGNDIDDTTSPLEAGLGWIVKLKSKGEFLGRSRIEKEYKNGVKRKLIGLEMIDRGIPRNGYLIYDKNHKEVGKITSGTMSPSLQKGIGMGYVITELSQPGNEVWVQIRNKYLKSRIVTLPFIKK
jgi:aminomethyltransferase